MGSSEGSREAGERARGWTARLWTLAGVLWGILLGAGAAMAVGGTAASFLWLYVFGDDPWPAWSRRAILAAGGSAAALALGTAAWAGRRHGLRAATGSPAERRLSRRRAMLTLLAALMGLGALGVAAWRQQAEATARREARDEAAGYLETRHRRRSGERRRGHAEGHRPIPVTTAHRRGAPTPRGSPDVTHWMIYYNNWCHS